MTGEQRDQSEQVKHSEILNLPKYGALYGRFLLASLPDAKIGKIIDPANTTVEFDNLTEDILKKKDCNPVFENLSFAERKEEWKGIEYSQAYNQWRTQFTDFMINIQDPQRLKALKTILSNNKEAKEFTIGDADRLFNEFCRGKSDIDNFIARVVTNLGNNGEINPTTLQELLPHLQWIASGLFGKNTSSYGVGRLIEIESAIHNSPVQVMEIFNSNKGRINALTDDEKRVLGPLHKSLLFVAAEQDRREIATEASVPATETATREQKANWRDEFPLVEVLRNSTVWTPLSDERWSEVTKAIDAIEKNPNDIDSYKLLANFSRLEIKDVYPNLTDRIYKEMIENNPGNAKVRFEYASVLFNDGRKEAAVHVLVQGIRDGVTSDKNEDYLTEFLVMGGLEKNYVEAGERIRRLRAEAATEAARKATQLNTFSIEVDGKTIGIGGEPRDWEIAPDSNGVPNGIFVNERPGEKVFNIPQGTCMEINFAGEYSNPQRFLIIGGEGIKTSPEWNPIKVFFYSPDFVSRLGDDVKAVMNNNPGKWIAYDYQNNTFFITRSKLEPPDTFPYPVKPADASTESAKEPEKSLDQEIEEAIKDLSEEEKATLRGEKSNAFGDKGSSVTRSNFADAILRKTGNLGLTTRIYAIAIEMDKENASLRAWKAEALGSDHPSVAIDVLREAVRDKVFDSRSLLILGSLLKLTNQPIDEINKAFDQIVKDKKENMGYSDINNYIDFVFAIEEDQSKAISFLEDAIATYPNNGNFRYVFAKLLDRVNQSDKAIEVLERAVQDRVTDPNDEGYLKALWKRHLELSDEQIEERFAKLKPQNGGKR